jgi:hypothetical protein
VTYATDWKIDRKCHRCNISEQQQASYKAAASYKAVASAMTEKQIW